MFMKRKELSSISRSKTDMSESAQDHLVLFPWPLQPSGGGLGGHNSALHGCGSGTRNNPRIKGEGGNGALGRSAAHKDVKNEDRSGNVYENKGRSDNFPDTKDDISARLHAILHGNARIWWELSAL
jgi:hypothetical protein